MKIKNLLKIAVVGFLVILGAAIAQADESGRAKIWFDIPGSSYVDANSDPWLFQSWLTSNPAFTLNVQNMLDSNIIYDAHLVLAIPHDAISAPWSIQIGSSTFGYSDFSNPNPDGKHTYLSNHGVYGGSDGAKWAEFTIGNIGALETIPLSFTVAGAYDGFLLHLDAYGSSLSDSQDGRYFAPYSHDANFVPEPISSALFLLGGGALAVRQYRKRRG